MPNMEPGFTSEHKSLLVEFKRAEILLFGKSIQEKFGLHSPVYLDLRDKLYDRVDLLWSIGGEFFQKINTLADEDSKHRVDNAANAIHSPDTSK